jgi:hypothetical protein
MSASTAPIGARGGWLDGFAERVRPGAVREAATNGRVYALLAAIALALGALSLLFPSTPTYDPWAWIIWGREIAHLDLQTTGGPSWKPLPVIFTTVFSIFGGAAPDLWLIVARAGAVLAIVLAFRLAFRLTTGEGVHLRSRALVPGVAAGIVAAMALVISSQFVRTMALGDSEGLLVAFALWGVERHLDGRYRQAFVLGLLAGLMRPEVWPFLGLYAIWLFLIDRAALKLIVLGFVAMLALWFLPEWWGSGNIWRAADRAQRPNPNSPAFAKHPFFRVLQSTWPLVITPVKAAAAFALVVAAWQWLRHRRQGAILVITALGLAWIVLIALMTQAGFSGNPRYIILGTTIVAIVGGVGFGRVVQFVGDFFGARFSTPVVAGAGVLAFAALFVGTLHWSLPRFRGFDNIDHALRFQAQLRFDMRDVIAKAGGAKRVAACGPAATGMYQVPMLAWYLGQHTLQVRLDPAPTGNGVILRSRATGGDRLAPFQSPTPYPAAYKPVAQLRDTTLFTTCAGAGSSPGA